MNITHEIITNKQRDSAPVALEKVRKEGIKGFSLEVHILDFNQDIYGSQLELIFVEKLRDEVKFETTGLLVEQIRKDIEEARIILKS